MSAAARDGEACPSDAAMRTGFLGGAKPAKSPLRSKPAAQQRRARALDDIDSDESQSDSGEQEHGEPAAAAAPSVVVRQRAPPPPAASPPTVIQLAALQRLAVDPETLREAARAMLERGEAQLAAGALRQLAAAEARGQAPPHAHTHYYLGVAEQATGNLEGALTCYERALELKPELLAPRRSLVPLLYAAGRRDEALVQAEYLCQIQLEARKAGAYYDKGTLLLQMDRNEEAVKALRQAINRQPEMTEAYVNHDAALLRLGRCKECREYAAQCARATGLWSHTPWQRPPHFVKGLKASAWHDRAAFPMAVALEANWRAIRAELDALRGGTEPWGAVGGRSHADSSLVASGEWREFLMLGGGPAVESEARRRCPKTHALLAQFEEAAACALTGVGEALFSVLAPGTRLRPHCGSTNTRLTCHLGLRVPKGCRIRCGGEWREWREGEAIVFDDSFEHEVEHGGDEPRVVLLINFFHPELPKEQWQPIQPLQPSG